MKSFIEVYDDIKIINEKLITFGNKRPRYNNVVILAGGGGCYPKGTEFFTNNGWKFIEEYKEGDNVLQIDIDGFKSSFVKPQEYIKLPVDKFIQIKNERVDFTTSIDHKHVVINEKTKSIEIKKTHELLEKHISNARGNKSYLINTFDYSGSGIDYSDDYIRLKIAVLADGHFLPRAYEKTAKCRISIKKDRKIKRIIELLELNTIEYKQYEENGFQRFEFHMDNKEKEFEKNLKIIGITVM